MGTLEFLSEPVLEDRRAAASDLLAVVAGPGPCGRLEVRINGIVYRGSATARRTAHGVWWRMDMIRTLPDGDWAGLTDAASRTLDEALRDRFPDATINGELTADQTAASAVAQISSAATREVRRAVEVAARERSRFGMDPSAAAGIVAAAAHQAVAANLTPGQFTVLGIWFDDQPVAVGAIAGVHQADGDLDYVGFQNPWAVSVSADTADEALETAVQTMLDSEA